MVWVPTICIRNQDECVFFMSKLVGIIYKLGQLLYLTSHSASWQQISGKNITAVSKPAENWHQKSGLQLPLRYIHLEIYPITFSGTFSSLVYTYYICPVLVFLIWNG